MSVRISGCVNVAVTLPTEAVASGGDKGSTRVHWDVITSGVCGAVLLVGLVAVVGLSTYAYRQRNRSRQRWWVVEFTCVVKQAAFVCLTGIFMRCCRCMMQVTVLTVEQPVTALGMILNIKICLTACNDGSLSFTTSCSHCPSSVLNVCHISFRVCVSVCVCPR